MLWTAMPAGPEKVRFRSADARGGGPVRSSPKKPKVTDALVTSTFANEESFRVHCATLATMMAGRHQRDTHSSKTAKQAISREKKIRRGLKQEHNRYLTFP